MIVRIATVEDAIAISELMKQLGYQTSAETLAEKLRLFERSENDEAAVVATQDQVVIGCISVHTQAA